MGGTYAKWTVDDSYNMAVDFPSGSNSVILMGDYSPLKSSIEDNGLLISSIKTAKLKGHPATIRDILVGFSGITSVDLSELDTSGVNSFAGVFGRCRSLREVDLSGIDTTKVTDIHGIFQYCKSLISVKLSGMNTANVKNMSAMFSGCISLQTVDLSGLDTSAVTDMGYMFHDCTALTSVDLSVLDTSAVMDMSGIFEACSNLADVNLSGVDTSNVKSMHEMFKGCTALTTIDLSGFNTANVNDMFGLFADCTLLTTIKLGSSFSTAGIGEGPEYDYLRTPYIAPCSNSSIYCADDAAFCSLSAAEHAGTWRRKVPDTYKVTGERTTDGKSDDDGNDVTFTVVWATTSTSSTRTLTIYRKVAGETDWPATAAGTWTLSGDSGNTVETLEDVGDAKADYRVVFDDGAVKHVALVTVEGNKRLVTVDENGNFWCAGTLPIDRIYPVGSIYLTMDSRNPGDIFGGTWEQIECGRFLVAAAGRTDGDTTKDTSANEGNAGWYPIGEKGGERRHTLSLTEMPAHNHGSAGAHTHRAGYKRPDAYGSGKVDGQHWINQNKGEVTTSSNGAHTHSTEGGGGSHENRPPYIAVAMWRRTA